jgi:stage V sporulation protein SpoVS
MNYQQTYDPMQASAMRQQQNLGLAQSIKGGLGAIQQGLQENAAWKAFEAKHKTATDAKANLWAVAKPIIQESGVDLGKVPALANIENDIANKDISASQFGATLEEALNPFKEAIMGNKTIAAQTLEARDPIKGIGTVEPMQSQSPQSSFMGPTAPVDSNSNFVGPQLPSGDSMYGAMEPIPQQDPMSADTLEQLQHKNVIAQQKAMIKRFEARAAAGSLDTGDEAKFSSDMMALSMKDKDIEIEKLRLDRTNAAKDKTQGADDVIDFAKNNFPLYDTETGKKIEQVNVADVRANPHKYSTTPGGKIFAPQGNYFGGGVRNPDETKLQTAVMKRLATMYPNDFSTGEDDYGNVVYRVKPEASAITKRVLSDPDSYNQFVIDYFPKYAQSLQIQKPTGKGNDPLGIR